MSSKPAARTSWSSALLSASVAWMILAAIVIGSFADEPLPPAYLLRPLVVVTGAALILGVVSLPLGAAGPAAAAGVALVLAVPSPAVALAALTILAGVEYLRRRSRGHLGGTRPTVTIAGIFLGLALVRAALVIDVWTDKPTTAVTGPSMYVVLLDGYPRQDSLAALGIDNQPFIDALLDRGFDYYPTAHSVHSRTNKTLLAMLTSESVTNDPASPTLAREIRRRLVVPPGFLAVDPPVGYVTLGPGRHLDPGGLNDFEAFLLGRSVVGVLTPDLVWNPMLDDLRDRLSRTLRILATSDERRIFAHLMVPHPPFLYGAAGDAEVPRWCWPACGLFDATSERLTIEADVWAAGMASQLGRINAELLDTVDAIQARHPAAVIVLFSDHGGRYSEADQDEMHRSFLAARTPGHPRLFAEAPRPDAVIQVLLDAYESPRDVTMRSARSIE
jgi:hypothetical protein